jgi:hypothetical protein
VEDRSAAASACSVRGRFSAQPERTSEVNCSDGPSQPCGHGFWRLVYVEEYLWRLTVAATVPRLLVQCPTSPTTDAVARRRGRRSWRIRHGCAL